MVKVKLEFLLFFVALQCISLGNDAHALALAECDQIVKEEGECNGKTGIDLRNCAADQCLECLDSQDDGQIGNREDVDSVNMCKCICGVAHPNNQDGYRQCLSRCDKTWQVTPTPTNTPDTSDCPDKAKEGCDKLGEGQKIDCLKKQCQACLPKGSTGDQQCDCACKARDEEGENGCLDACSKVAAPVPNPAVGMPPQTF